MKHLANLISISRIGLLIALFFSLHNASLFVTLYIICGLSDVLDGYVARQTNTASELGARLDSAADLLLFAIITVSMVVWLGKEVTIFLPWIVLITIVRITNLCIAARKYHSFAILHTYGNKITGLLVFVSPMFILLHQPAMLWLACVAAVLSSVEETAIHLTSAHLDVNRRSLFVRP